MHSINHPSFLEQPWYMHMGCFVLFFAKHEDTTRPQDALSLVGKLETFSEYDLMSIVMESSGKRYHTWLHRRGNS